MDLLAAEALQAVARGDREALERLALSKEEFRRWVWPELPASNPKANVSLDYVWADVAMRSRLRLDRLLASFGGRRFHLVRVVHRGKVHAYASHKAYSDMQVTAKDESGKEYELDLFGTLIEMDETFKVYSYAPYR